MEESGSRCAYLMSADISSFMNKLLAFVNWLPLLNKRTKTFNSVFCGYNLGVTQFFDIHTIHNVYFESIINSDFGHFQCQRRLTRDFFGQFQASNKSSVLKFVLFDYNVDQS